MLLPQAPLRLGATLCEAPGFILERIVSLQVVACPEKGAVAQPAWTAPSLMTERHLLLFSGPLEKVSVYLVLENGCSQDLYLAFVCS